MINKPSVALQQMQQELQLYLKTYSKYDTDFYICIKLLELWAINGVSLSCVNTIRSEIKKRTAGAMSYRTYLSTIKSRHVSIFEANQRRTHFIQELINHFESIGK
jgi:hypothetical protein